MSRVAVYLLCYRRPEYVTRAIDSILLQDYGSFDLIVSDNSGDGSLEVILEKYKGNKKVQILTHKPGFGAIEHFNYLLKHSMKYEFFMLFHDDDVMLPGAVSMLLSAMDSFQACAAVASNARIIDSKDNQLGLFTEKLQVEFQCLNSEAVIQGYIDPKVGHPPFPSFLYRSSAVNGVTMNLSEGGKHCDASFIYKIACRGDIIWLNQPLLSYRRHDGNDSNLINLGDLFSLCRFFWRQSRNARLKISIFFIRNLAKAILLNLKKNYFKLCAIDRGNT